MITQITSLSETEIMKLKLSWQGKKILAYFKAYGTDYDFCRFFRLEYDSKEGWMFLLNSTLVICAEDEIPTEEIIMFIQMHLPFRIECPQYMIPYLSDISNYQKLRRTMFELIPHDFSQDFKESDVDMNPNLTDVYNILKEGFPNLIEYPLWLTDTSHRCRHGISHVLNYKDSTTVTLIFDIDDTVLVGQVATKPSARGSGYARDFLKWLAQWLKNFGKQAVLYALDIRVSFYKEIGFKEIETEYVLERKDIEKESIEKGALQ